MPRVRCRLLICVRVWQCWQEGWYVVRTRLLALSKGGGKGLLPVHRVLSQGVRKGNVGALLVVVWCCVVRYVVVARGQKQEEGEEERGGQSMRAWCESAEQD